MSKPLCRVSVNIYTASVAVISPDVTLYLYFLNIHVDRRSVNIYTLRVEFHTNSTLKQFDGNIVILLFIMLYKYTCKRKVF